MADILIIEDDRTLRRQIAQLLRLEGHQAREAENGRVGVELAKANPPDLVVCDIMMPELDGFGVLQSLRESPPTSGLPFIFLTARVENRDLRQGMDLGADDYLTKPFDPHDLLTSVRQRLKRRQRQVEEIQRGSEEAGLAVASILPMELAEPLDHIDTVSNLMVLEQAAALPRAAELQRSLRLATTRMRRMVQRLNIYTQLPQLYAHRFELELEGCVADPGAVVAREAQAMATQWQRQAEVRLSATAATLAIQETYLAILCQELIENACKFSPAATPIAVSTHTEQGAWMLEILNHGPGLRPADIARIGAFKQFWTGLRKPRGLGLGLVLAQGILRLHGGELAIHSRPGETTSVRVLLPLSRPGAANSTATRGALA